MNVVNDIINPLNKRIDLLTIRERAIIAVTLVVAVVFIWTALLMDQQIADLKASRKQVSQQTTVIKNMQQVQKNLTGKLNADPNHAEQVRLERYLNEAKRIDKELREQTLEFISPKRMVEVLRDVIRQEGGLRLVSLESIDPEDPLANVEVNSTGGESDATSDAETNASKSEASRHSGAYLHTIKLKFKGDYLSAMRYLERLELLEWRFIWKSLSIRLEDYPVTSVELHIQTLGLTEGWIGV